MNLKYTKIDNSMGYKKDIDLTIVKLIEFLNKKGYCTKASCSGVVEDHMPENNDFYYTSLNKFLKIGYSKEQAEKFILQNNGYIYCYNELPIKLREGVENLGFYINNFNLVGFHGMYLDCEIRIETDNIKKEVWKKLTRFLIKNL